MNHEPHPAKSMGDVNGFRLASREGSLPYGCTRLGAGFPAYPKGAIMGYKVAILGASGAVGQEFIRLLEQREFPVEELRLLASSRSAGKTYPFRGRLHKVEEVTEKSFEGVQIGLFSAGASVSKTWAPVAASKGAIVIDNTSQFRMDEDIPLVVPECNTEAIEALPGRRIIANPNCSTIQMVQVLKPLHEKFGLKRLVISTFQSVSGKGSEAIDELRAQTEAILLNEDPVAPSEFPHPIAFNVLPQIDVFLPNGYTKEEMKMVNETRKILGIPGLPVSATCVRVPVIRAHSEAVTAEFEKPVTPAEARALLAKAPGVVVVDDPEKGDYPLPIYAEGRYETYVGRIREDISLGNGRGLVMWIVSDNLLKGAALNAVQIAEWLIEKNKI
jgi:aspartate-semialdehyde dehydrogenase